MRPGLWEASRNDQYHLVDGFYISFPMWGLPELSLHPVMQIMAFKIVAVPSAWIPE